MIGGRRLFLKWAVVFPWTSLIPRRAEALPAMSKTANPGADYLLNVFSIAGFQYHDGPKRLHHLRTGECLELTAEPDNPHDEFAVRIERRGVMLGYVPRSDNRHLHRLLRQGARLSCGIVEVNRKAPPWNQVRVEVRHRV